MRGRNEGYTFVFYYIFHGNDSNQSHQVFWSTFNLSSQTKKKDKKIKKNDKILKYQRRRHSDIKLFWSLYIQLFIICITFYTNISECTYRLFYWYVLCILVKLILLLLTVHHSWGLCVYSFFLMGLFCTLDEQTYSFPLWESWGKKKKNKSWEERGY